VCLVNASKVSFYMEGRWNRPLVLREQERVREWMSSVCGCAGGSGFGCARDCGYGSGCAAFFIPQNLYSYTFFLSCSCSLAREHAWTTARHGQMAGHGRWHWFGDGRTGRWRWREWYSVGMGGGADRIEVEVMTLVGA
jgi:hypothetical protein